MSIDSQLAQYFKPALRSGGEALKSKVKASRPSDTEILAYIRSSSSLRVHIRCESLDSDTLNFDCSCPVFQKHQICKHLWAALLEVDKKFPDFLDGKVRLDTDTLKIKAKVSVSASQLKYKVEAQRRQSEYQKLQYEKQKLRKKESKLFAKTSKFSAEALLPPAVERALSYFAENGFLMSKPLQAEEIRSTKKKLARLFHPDFGGSHEEIVALNMNFKVLIDFLESSEKT